MKYTKYNKHKNLVTFSNSLLKRYNCKTYHKSISDIDVLLKRKRKVVVILFDGLGKSIIKNILPKSSNFRKNNFMTISSTFPPTTVAATNALLSGKYPNETGWIGWTTYIKSIDKVVEMFTGKEYVSKVLIKNEDLCRDLFPYENIFNTIRNNNPSLHVGTIYGQYSTINRPNSISEVFDQIEAEVNGYEDSLTYAYYPEPDTTLHEFGENSKEVKVLVEEIESYTTRFAEKHKDTLVIVIADHSHILVEPIYFNRYEDITECLSGVYSIEARCASFRLKPNPALQRQFVTNFKKHFGKDFVLLTRQEALDKELFGPTSTQLKGFEKYIGDYVALATTNRYFELNENHPFISTHAGATKRELNIQVTVFNEHPKR
ncbi:MAG: alkaline phosphatase family protein [Bacilli bacterium]